ncbi:MAG: LysR substrate-binding domain-containing protein [Capsulimonadales bacterium]|nr:LysR substrate-binding domain-containing protein [Capsulimonadales bacterium]
MEVFQLRYFLAAARLGSFSRAAEECHISQPSLSVQIANLERETGAALFVRTGRAVTLTDAGQTLVEFAERILRTEEEARRAVREVVGLERGRLSLWTLPTPGQNLLPPVLARFRREHPAIAITVHETVPARVVGEAVAGGRADLGLVHLPCAVPGLIVRELFTEELALVVPESHPLVGTEPPLSAVAGEDFVWVPQGETPEHPIYAACLAAGFTPRIACVSGSASGMQALVAAGLGIALLPRLALNPPAGAVLVELAPPRPTRTLAVVRRTADLSHAARAFLRLLDGRQEDSHQ